MLIVKADPTNRTKLAQMLETRNIYCVHLVNGGAWSGKDQIYLGKSEVFYGDHKLTVPDVCIDNDFKTEYSYNVPIEVDTVDDSLTDLDTT